VFTPCSLDRGQHGAARVASVFVYLTRCDIMINTWVLCLFMYCWFHRIYDGLSHRIKHSALLCFPLHSHFVDYHCTNSYIHSTFAHYCRWTNPALLVHVTN
jgi:hypothetical protein